VQSTIAGQPCSQSTIETAAVTQFVVNYTSTAPNTAVISVSQYSRGTHVFPPAYSIESLVARKQARRLEARPRNLINMRVIVLATPRDKPGMHTKVDAMAGTTLERTAKM
jgi:hypothetical protein